MAKERVGDDVFFLLSSFYHNKVHQFLILLSVESVVVNQRKKTGEMTPKKTAYGCFGIHRLFQL